MVTLSLSELVDPAEPVTGVLVLQEHGGNSQFVEWRSLTAKAQDGEFVLDLLDIELDEVRLPVKGRQRSGNAFGSIEWDVGVVTQDSDLVRQCFDQFLASGDVSRELLDT